MIIFYKIKTIFLCFFIIFSICNSKNIEREHESNCNITNEIINTKEITNNTQKLEYEIIDYNIWKLEIPKINLVANISEGTEKNVLDEYIGHFKETQKSTGNIGLAAHNRGYKVNYFNRLKELEKGDEIYYTYNGKKSVFVVNTRTIIEDTDWSKLQNTEDNILTLITCVENQPNYRRCIQAVRIEN